MAHVYALDNPYEHPDLIRGVVFDNDGTLYKNPENAHEYHKLAAIDSVQQQCPDLADWQIRNLMVESNKKYGAALDIFVQEHGADRQQLRADHFDSLIRISLENDFFRNSETPHQSLAQLAFTGVQLTIATHGNKDWTVHSLSQNQLAHMFNDQTIITKDKIGKGKNLGPEMYEAALDAMSAVKTDEFNLRGRGYATVEDTMANLMYAKDLGMMTVLINEGRYEPEDIADYVDVVVFDNDQAVRVIQESNEEYIKSMPVFSDNADFDDDADADYAELTIES